MILNHIENSIIDDMSKRQVRYITPIPMKQSEKKLKSVYLQIRTDFQLVPPLTLFSPVPELLAAVWSIWRESQFVSDNVSRVITETVAAGVSSINECAYCVDAHTGMLHALAEDQIVKSIHAQSSDSIKNKSHSQILEWALANRHPDAKCILRPPFTKPDAPEIIGTAFVYHFVNRMVSIFLTESPLPLTAGSAKIRQGAAKVFGKTIGKSITHRTSSAGKSLMFIPCAELPEDFNWAEGRQNVARAFAGFTHTIEQLSIHTIPVSVRQLIEKRLARWRGEQTGISREWIEESILDINDNDKPCARLLLLTALAPYQVSAEDIQEFRKHYPGDHELLVFTAWASFTAARRVCQWLNIFSK